MAPKEILDGFYADPKFAHLYDLVKQSPPQLILKNVSFEDFKEVYEVERLAFEVWKTMAMRRSVGKGAALIVSHTPPYLGDTRTDELNDLINNFDSRNETLDHSAIGAAFQFSGEKTHAAGIVILPQYNVDRLGVFREAARAFKYKNVRIDGQTTNFIWVPFFLRGFYEVHLPLAAAFQAKHGASYNAVLAVVATLLAGCLQSLLPSDDFQFFRYWQRAYEGPDTLALLKKHIAEGMDVGIALLGIQSKPSTQEIDVACDFLSRKEARRNSIDIGLAGPMSLGLPIDDMRVFIDYAWLSRILYTLFHGVSIPDQNFKGDALEAIVRPRVSVIPHAELIAADDSRKQLRRCL